MAPEAHADGADLASMRAMRPPTHALQRLASDLERLCSTAELRRRFPPRVMAEFILALASGATLESAANPAALPFEVLSQMVVVALGFTDLEETLVATDSGDPIGGEDPQIGQGDDAAA